MSGAQYERGNGRSGAVVHSNPGVQAADNPQNVLRRQLTQMGPEIKNALPSHIKPEKFQRVVMTVVQQTPDLLEADRRSLLASCMKCAADGLIPDGREAALVIFNTKTKAGNWEKRVQYMPMMAGILKRIRNSDEVASIQAHVIYENDKFLIRRGLNDTLEHEPLFPGDRGKPIGAYAVAKFKDGSEPQFEVMDINDINRVRSVSRAKDAGPWVQWWDEMARKTVFRRLSKWLPMDAEVEGLMRRDDELGGTEGSSPVIDAVASEQKPSKLDALEHSVTIDDGSFSVDGDAVEVLADQGAEESSTALDPDPLDAYREDAAYLLSEIAKVKSSAALNGMLKHAAIEPKIKALAEHASDIHRQVLAAIDQRRQELLTGPSGGVK